MLPLTTFIVASASVWVEGYGYKKADLRKEYNVEVKAVDCRNCCRNISRCTTQQIVHAVVSSLHGIQFVIDPRIDNGAMCLGGFSEIDLECFHEELQYKPNAERNSLSR